MKKKIFLPYFILFYPIFKMSSKIHRGHWLMKFCEVLLRTSVTLANLYKKSFQPIYQKIPCNLLDSNLLLKKIRRPIIAEILLNNLFVLKDFSKIISRKQLIIS